MTDLKKIIKTFTVIEKTDTMRFFIGDKPAVQFERGTQQGGNFPCSCGVHLNKFKDPAVTLRHSPKSLKEKQKMATLGKFGKQTNVLKPFSRLTKSDILMELDKRGHRDVYDLTKPQLEYLLRNTLTGVQRVPALLLPSPTVNLESLSLQTYSVMDCEPLHDFKGYAMHLINQVSKTSHLSSSIKHEIKEYITKSRQGEQVSGSDIRCAVLHIYQILVKSNASWKRQTLFLSLTQISQVLYSSDTGRCGKQILKFYSCCWLHHELNVELFPQPSETALHGIYFHALLTHAPVQQEIICNRSVNTESEEQILQKAKSCVRDTSDRKANTLIPYLLMRLEAKEILYNSTATTVYESDTRIKKVAKLLPAYKGTKISITFIKDRPYQWQAHLERISPFLLLGKGHWWDLNEDQTQIIFRDGDSERETLPNAPNILHFRSDTGEDVIERSKHSFSQLIAEKRDTPCFSIRMYSELSAMLDILPGYLNTSERLYEQSDLEHSLPSPSTTTTDSIITQQNGLLLPHSSTLHSHYCFSEKMLV